MDPAIIRRPATHFWAPGSDAVKCMLQHPAKPVLRLRCVVLRGDGCRHHGTKKRLYLSRPEPDVLTSRRRVTRIIPPTPPPCEEPVPVPVIEEPAEPEPCPPAPCPSPPALPAPEPQIEVIAVDVEPSVKSSKSSRSRSRGHSHTREKEVYVERDRFVPVPVPVPVEPRYETYRYVEAPRRYVEPPRERKMIEDNKERVTHVHVHTEDRETSRERRAYRDRDCYDREYYDSRDYYRR
ncbi:hypothetical protein MAA_03985 [Metarhizium robertsii ARSEF 23]|uniref:Uncharacterized protein n=1 Tax=Metarhizium robertsii (strain ARSEF 23 / ATCC MYA-3075) TaxID=655844 RepID=E9EVD6_METRA|nr:uncharacterized protein MAA_03985 [Metarhizium robertsii ARSEF 23]EFZ00208.2 hypothetical protein MAA_03985 [Metarhizium robertsii ARSEF 23]